MKNNQELNASDQIIQPLNNLVMGKLIKHPVYLAGALPLKIATPFYAKYGKGVLLDFFPDLFRCQFQAHDRNVAPSQRFRDRIPPLQ